LKKKRILVNFVKISFFVLLFCFTALFVINYENNVYAATEGQLSSLSGVTITATNGATNIADTIGSGTDLYLYQVNEKIYFTYNYEETDVLDYFTDIYLYVSSTNSNYKYIYFYNSGYLVQVDIYNSLGTAFVIFDHVGVGNEFVITMADDFSFYNYGDTFIYIVDESERAVASYERGYSEGYDRGVGSVDALYDLDPIDTYDDDSFDAGYSSGFSVARSLYGSFVEGSWLSYSDGLENGADMHYALLDFVPSVLGLFIGFFFQLSSVSALGVSALDILGALFAISIVLLFFKIFVSK
jgi:hypothetical protein